MPQPPSPSMGIIWPTDNDDANAWAPIMDTAIRVTIDGHNHSPGSGAQISIGSLKFDVDISAVDAGGGKHAITSLKTISFFPSPPPVGTNGSFFIADGTSGTVLNELYYRTTLGANVQVSSGATLNVGAFAGTIGGDYTGVAALESFVDAADAYLFQQQVGGGVRQFAKMQCADVELFEFKSVAGGPPVPTQAVTLKSPAALAAGYALTMPAALPAGNTFLMVNNAGALTDATDATPAANANIVLSGTGKYKHGTKTLSIHGSAFQSASASYSAPSQGCAFTSPGGTTIQAPIVLPVGARILAVRAFVKDNATAPTKITATLYSLTNAAVLTAIASSAQSSGAGTNQTLTITPAATVIAASTGYAIALASNNSDTCLAYTAEVDYDQP